MNESKELGLGEDSLRSLNACVLVISHSPSTWRHFAPVTGSSFLTNQAKLPPSLRSVHVRCVLVPGRAV